ncbi:MAG: hypothetical protein AAF750_18485 [Planctomycetota bacterium]
MSTNRIDIYGVIGKSAESIHRQLDEIHTCAAETELREHSDYAELVAACEEIQTTLDRSRNSLPVAFQLSYVDSYSVGLSQVHTLGWPDRVTRLVPGDLSFIAYYSRSEFADQLNLIKKYSRREVFKRDDNFRLYCLSLRQAIDFLLHIESQSVIVVTFTCLGPSRFREDTLESTGCDITLKSS